MLTHLHRRGALARRVFDRLVESRSQQDNEQWHLLTLNDLATRAEAKRPVLRHRVIPQLIAMAYCHLAWLLFVVKPAWSYRLNTHFEDHALTRVHALRRRTPNWSTNPTRAPSPPTTGATPGLADLLRQIGHDERTHKQKASCRPPPPTRRALRTRLKRPYYSDSDSGSRHRLPRGAMGALNDERCLL